jgi:hypothetical protein
MNIFRILEHGFSLLDIMHGLMQHYFVDNDTLQLLKKRILSVGQITFICSLRFASQMIGVLTYNRKLMHDCLVW